MKRIRSSSITALAVIILVGWVELPCAGAQSRTRFARWAYQDAGALLSRVNHRTPVYIAGGAVVLASLSSLDASFLKEVQGGYTGGLATYLNATNELGGPRALVPVAALFATSLATNKPRFQDAAFTSFQALLYAGAITSVFKQVFGRYRPEAEAGSYRFSPLSGNTSFPSGHTTAAFAIVTPWVLYYPNVATYGLFALSAGTAIARIARDKHWPTDVLAGAAVGFLTAQWLSRRHQDRQALPLSVTPLMGPSAAGLVVRVRLGV